MLVREKDIKVYKVHVHTPDAEKPVGIREVRGVPLHTLLEMPAKTPVYFVEREIQGEMIDNTINNEYLLCHFATGVPERLILNDYTNHYIFFDTCLCYHDVSGAFRHVYPWFAYYHANLTGLLNGEWRYACEEEEVGA